MIGAYYWYVKIPQCGYVEHGLKDIAFYVQKHITHRTVYFNFPLVRDKPLGAPAFVRLVYCSDIKCDTNILNFGIIDNILNYTKCPSETQYVGENVVCNNISDIHVHMSQ